jgi:uncharacterized protein YfiM (DUF2279 family)
VTSSRRIHLSASALILVLVLRFPLLSDSWFGPDKIKHFFLTAFAQSFLYASARAAGVERDDALRASITAAAAGGIAREIYDARAKGRFSLPDLAFDAAGVVAATAMLRETK